MQTKTTTALILTLFILLGVHAQQYPTFYTAEQLDSTSASFNLRNRVGFWHFSGPRSSFDINNPLSIYWNDGTYHRFFDILDNGNVGIGTSTPVSRLEVNGDIALSRTHKIKFLETVGGTDRAYIRSTNGENGNFNSLIFAIGGGQESMIIEADDGNVGIGTLSPGLWKLAVNGNIRAKEIKVETGWSDFVFEEDYPLPTLNEVEQYIKENGHLKDIPSAEEVEVNGIFLGEMDAKLLQKIEELTLYTIQQEKKLKSQSNTIAKQQGEIEELQRQVRLLLIDKN
ncbi:hypothetical protein [Ascidiimonas aurantiaca]|uniref:hypothetical protein n=1 Tax=Ascidiimonas aurantiaca TaxID=1685432 RepID=UPI0030ECF331